MAAGGNKTSPQSPSPVIFARNFFRALNDSGAVNGNNLIVSPVAARSAMTLVLMGSGGKSADELRSGLLLGTVRKLEIARQHAEFLNTDCVCNPKGVSMRLATGLYVKHDQQLHADFNLKAVQFFNAQADGLNFADAAAAMQHVNKWLERQTFYTVRHLLSPASFNPNSSVILVNSLYFRAKWATRFSVERTAIDDFRINQNQRMMVPMMRQEGQFRFGESRRLKSRILQMPFEESDIYMLFIVPHAVNGLAALESKLSKLDLNEVARKAVMHDVDVTLPKFKIECEVDLKLPLQKLGVRRIFEPGAADLSRLFAKKSPHRITEARQKVSLNVNEAGCGTADHTQGRVAAAKVNPERKVFKANQPFVFAIRSNKTVYFVGHFLKP
ncbi:GH23432 [Drosophila grimshawi]|uniref:GH23432 n=1 Tax=Drosophila grimshawi TaxID=7222 RepID=B4K2K8_DROGR|nr:GH23432 [Drosophila grimshawi]